MNRRKYGVALILTLVVTFFLMVLLGAFIIVNRSNNSLTVSGIKRQQAYNACVSGLHYAWSELEANQYWGAGGFPEGTRNEAYPAGNPKIALVIHGQTTDPGELPDLTENYVEGEFPGTEDGFKVTMINNLQRRAVLEDTPLGNVPGRCAKMRVEGYSGSYKLTLESVLRKKPYVDYSALSSLDMTIELDDAGADNRWTIASSDPYINQVRSNTNIDAPSALDDEVKFRVPPRGGVAKAHTDILLGGTSIDSDPDFQESSESMADGGFKVGSSPIDIPGLSQEDLQFPESQVTIPPGTMTFKKVYKNEVLERDVDLDGDGTFETHQYRVQKQEHDALVHGSGASEDYWISSTSRPSDDNDDQPWSIYPPSVDDGDFDGILNPPDDLNDFPVLYETDEQHRVSANLTTGELAFTPATKFVVNGDIEFIQDESSHQAHLKFGHEMQPDGTMEFTGGSQGNDALADPQSNSAALVADGNIILDGITSGFGSIYADGEVQLRAKSGMRADPDLAVAVHGDQVSMRAEDPPEGFGQNSLLDTDWEFFREVVAQYPEEQFNDWNDLSTTRRFQQVGDNPDLDTGIRARQLDPSHTPSYIWNKLQQELGDDIGPLPNLGSAEGNWSGTMTLEHYVRLRQCAKSGDRSWLDRPGTRFTSVVGNISGQLGTYSNWSSRMGQPNVKAFMGPAEPPILAENFFVGLVHAGRRGLYVDPNGARFLIEGAAVSEGTMTVRNAPTVDFVYNRLFLDDVVKKYAGEFIQLDQVYFKLN